MEKEKKKESRRPVSRFWRWVEKLKRRERSTHESGEKGKERYLLLRTVLSGERNQLRQNPKEGERTFALHGGKERSDHLILSDVKKRKECAFLTIPSYN